MQAPDLHKLLKLSLAAENQVGLKRKIADYPMLTKEWLKWMATHFLKTSRDLLRL
jgi:hypothetical protein